MSNQIVPFEFGGEQIRVVTIGGEPWFVARDVAQVLGYADPTNAIKQHSKGVATHHPLQTAGGVQQTRVISEPDVLRLIMSSRLPAAERFEKWVFEFVLPEIRKTGSYAKPLTLAEKSIALLTELTGEVQRQAAEIATLEPKAGAWDDLASGAGDYSVGDAAKMLARAGIETGRDRLFATLHEFGWVFRQSGRFQARQTAVDSGYLRQKPQSHLHPETREVVLDAPQIRVTLRGLERLRVRLGSMLNALEAVA